MKNTAGNEGKTIKQRVREAISRIRNTGYRTVCANDLPILSAFSKWLSEKPTKI